VEDADFSDSFCRFLQDTVPAIDAAELLIWLAQNRGRTLESGRILEAVGAASNLSEAAAGRYLDLFRSRGLVESPDGKVYRFAPAPDREEHVRMLTQAYHGRPVTLIRVIYALRDARIQTFAEAFRLKRKETK
jgi:hypothetical protein